MAASWLIYGATGYTGQLMAAEAARRGLRPVLAGRHLGKVQAIAAPHGFEARAADLTDAPKLRELVRGQALVLHAAGPFRETSAPMVEACIAEGASYLDITGELGVFSSVFERDAAARAAGIALIPGVGFDVVPTDCLARYVAERVPGASRLEIAIAPHGGMSSGTAKSMLASLPEGGFVRRGGELVHHALGRGARRIRFSDKERWTLPIPWGDLVTAFRTTRIPDITTYAAVPAKMARALEVGWPALWAGGPLSAALLRSARLRSAANRFVESRIAGPDAARRERGFARVWARASGSTSFEAWLDTIEPYAFTAVAAIDAVERVLKDSPKGALTPAVAFGADFALGVRGTVRRDVPAEAASRA